MHRSEARADSDPGQCLLPLANTPLIEYTLEFLANAGVEDVFLYGGLHSDQLEKYIKYALPFLSLSTRLLDLWVGC